MNQKQFLVLASKSFGVKISKVSINLKLNEIEEWDSIGHLTLLSNLDKATKGKTSEIKGLGTQKSLKKIWDTLKRKGLVK
jgi:hypothetical protein